MHNQIKIYHKLVSKSYFWPVSSVWLKSESWDLSDSVSEMSVTSTSEVAVASGMVKINCSILTEVNKKEKKNFSLSQPHSKNKLSSDILLWSLLSKSKGTTVKTFDVTCEIVGNCLRGNYISSYTYTKFGWGWEKRETFKGREKEKKSRKRGAWTKADFSASCVNFCLSTAIQVWSRCRLNFPSTFVLACSDR